MPLRARILIVTVALFLVGLGAVTFTTYHFLSSSLVGRLDAQLKAASGPVAETLTRAHPRHPGAHGVFLPTGSYAALLDEHGRVRREAWFAFGQEAQRPEIPTELIRSQTLDREPILATVSAERGGTEYRLIAKPLGKQGTIGVAAYWLTRRELRPLERMAEQSRAIAAGDLSQRLQPDDPRTEVGLLGGALNAMLAEIERAFAERLAAEERLRRFVADASHELRTPVTSIRGYAELFRRGAGDRPADLANVMRRIEEEGKRMGELVEELLLLARLDQGLTLERRPVEVSAVLDAAVDAARPADPGRLIDVDSQRPLVVLGSASRLRQVIDNLLTNARVHTPAGTPIHVRLAAEHKQVVLAVADEGPGVPAEEADRIFERFYRTDRSRTRSQGGVGLGLAVVRSVVEAHGGAVGFRARPGGGSSVRIVLPLAPAARAGDARPATATASAERPRRR